MSAMHSAVELGLAVTQLGEVVEARVEEGGAEDMAELARDLANIGSSASVFGDTDFFFEAGREVARWGNFFSPNICI